MFAADKRDLSGWGRERIEANLRERGLPEAAIEAATAVDDHDAQLERALGLLQRRGPAPTDDRERASALGYLTRRGYGYELAYEAVRRCSHDDDLAA